MEEIQFSDLSPHSMAFRIKVNKSESGSGKFEFCYFETRTGLDSCLKEYMTIGVSEKVEVWADLKTLKVYTTEEGKLKEIILQK